MDRKGGKKIYAIESVHGYKSLIVRIKLGSSKSRKREKKKKRNFLCSSLSVQDVYSNYFFFNNSWGIIFYLDRNISRNVFLKYIVRIFLYLHFFFNRALFFPLANRTITTFLFIVLINNSSYKQCCSKSECA